MAENKSANVRKENSQKNRTSKKNTTRKNNTSIKNTKIEKEKKDRTKESIKKRNEKDRDMEAKENNYNKRFRDEIIICCTLVFCIILILSNFHMGGIFEYVCRYFFGLFGFLNYFMPLLLFGGVVFYVANQKNKSAIQKLYASVGLFVVALPIMEMLSSIFDKTPKEEVWDYFTIALKERSGGGLLGGSIYKLFSIMVGKVGAFVILMAITAVLIMFLTEKLLFASLGKKGKKKMVEIKEKRRIRQEEEYQYQSAMVQPKRKAKTYKIQREDTSMEEIRKRSENLFENQKEDVMENSSIEQNSSKALHTFDFPKERRKNKKQRMQVPTIKQDAEESIENIVIHRAGQTEVLQEQEIDMNKNLEQDETVVKLPIYEEVLMQKFNPKKNRQKETNLVILPNETVLEEVDEMEDMISSQSLFTESEHIIKKNNKHHAMQDAFISNKNENHIPIMSNPKLEQTQLQDGFIKEPEDNIEKRIQQEYINREESEKLQQERLKEKEELTEKEEFVEKRKSLEKEEYNQQERIELEQELQQKQGQIQEFLIESFSSIEEGKDRNRQEDNIREQGIREQNNKKREESQLEPVKQIKRQEEYEKNHIPVKEMQEKSSNKTNIITQKTMTEQQEKKELQKQMNVQPTIPKKPYQFPPIDLLAKPRLDEKGISDEELKATAMKLQSTLNSFGVHVTITNVSCGPTVTRYELQPEQGVKVSKITGLSDDIKLNLAAADIRIEAPIPGKAAVGIEVPNKEISMVMFRELMESKEFRKKESNIAFAVGKDIAGQVVVDDIAKMPHLLIAGATGSGKSVCINTLIMSILYKAKPEDVKLIMVDPKVVELSVYNGIPHLLIPVVTDPKKASAALNWAVMEMTERYNKFAELGVRDLKGYNAKVAIVEEDKDERYQKMPQIVIIVDELADLMMVAPGEVEEAICRLAQLARAAGIHLIIATQRPSVNVITGVIKANVPSRIAFSVSSAIDSRTILDGGGAEKLLGKGDMLFFPSGISKPVRVQGAFISDKEVSDVVEFLIQQNSQPEYNDMISNQITSAVQSIESASNQMQSDRDDYFIEAGKFIIEKDKASIGMLQRVYKIGFNRAARIMDQLYEAGVVGAEEGTKPRKVLMSMEEFEQYIDEYV